MPAYADFYKLLDSDQKRADEMKLYLFLFTDVKKKKNVQIPPYLRRAWFSSFVIKANVYAAINYLLWTEKKTPPPHPEKSLRLLL